jgi:hypothetical protein
MHDSRILLCEKRECSLKDELKKGYKPEIEHDNHKKAKTQKKEKTKVLVPFQLSLQVLI